MDGKLLKGTIIAKGYTVDKFCKAAEFSKTSFYRKLEGVSEFTRKEIEKIIIILQLCADEVIKIFFAKKVS